MEGYIYAARFGESVIKFGFAIYPTRRVSDLPPFDGVKGELVGAVTGTLKQERRLHSGLGEFRIKGEYYRRGSERIEQLVSSFPVYVPPENHLHRWMTMNGVTLGRLSHLMRVYRYTVVRWAETAVPVWRVAELARVTGMPHELIRPDLYPRDGEAA